MVTLSRRAFLLTAAGASQAFAGPDCAPIRIAFLGAGPMARKRCAGTVYHDPSDFPFLLADPSVDAVCIGGAVSSRAQWTVAACDAGKDVYVEIPCCLSAEEAAAMVSAARRHGRVVQTGAIMRSGSVYRSARRVVRSGVLGEIAYCRIDSPESLDLIHYVFDDKLEPVSARSPLSYRYPAFVVSWEAGDPGVSFCGTRATLRVERNACRISPGGTVIEVVRGDNPAQRHWENWLSCIRTRSLPVSDIATARV